MFFDSFLPLGCLRIIAVLFLRFVKVFVGEIFCVDYDPWNDLKLLQLPALYSVIL